MTARPTVGATIAWATTCMSDENGKPIAGHANFGPANMDSSPFAQPLQARRGRARRAVCPIWQCVHVACRAPRVRACADAPLSPVRAAQVSTAIHEISHALGFSGAKFGDFRVPGTTTRRGAQNVMTHVCVLLPRFLSLSLSLSHIGVTRA